MKNEVNFRYPGVVPFTEEQRPIFFGREKDIERLHNLVLRNDLVVLYGASGLGKSSLVNAGLVPALRESEEEVGILPIHIRFSYYQAGKPSPTERVLQTIRFALGQTTVPAWLGTAIPEEETLWYQFKAVQLGNSPTLFLVFDQFEELFSYPAEQILEFKKQMAELLYTAMPQRIDKKFRERLKLQPDLVGKTEQRTLYKKQTLKVCIAIREDRYSQLNLLADYLPNITLTHYELTHFSPAQARKAIVAPALQEGTFQSTTFTYTPEALDKIISSLSSSKNRTVPIETTQLQIVCKHIEAKKLKEVKETDVPEFDDIFAQYYQEALAEVPTESRLPTQRFIEGELVQEHRRITVDEVKFKSNQVPEEAIRALVNAHFLRAIKNNNNDNTFSYEVAHDTLIAPIEQAREARQKAEKEAKEAQDRIEEDARLREQAKKDAEEKRKIKRQLQRTRLLLGGAVVGLLIAIVATIIAYFAYTEAKNQETKALTAKASADSASIEAKKQRTEALTAKEKAETSEKNAQQEKARAEQEKDKAQKAVENFKQEKANAYIINAQNMINLQEYRIARNYLDSAQSYQPNHSKIQVLRNALK